MSNLPKSIKSLEPLFSHKHGDKIHYKTPRGNIKVLVYGVQTWYRRCTPKRIIATLRGKRWFREPNLSEVISYSWQKRYKKLANAITDKNPLFAALKKHGAIKQYNGGAAIAKPIKCEEK